MADGLTYTNKIARDSYRELQADQGEQERDGDWLIAQHRLMRQLVIARGKYETIQTTW